MLQPWLPVAATSQLVPSILPLERPLRVMVQPEVLWRVIWFVVAELTPSMISTSPELGQLGPRSQLCEISGSSSIFRAWTHNAGHVPQIPPGICSRSNIIRPWLYEALLDTRTLIRPGACAIELWSTPMYAWLLLVLIRPRTWACVSLM